MPNQSQLSPPTGGLARSATPSNNIGLQGYPGGMVMHVPHPGGMTQTSPQAQGILYIQPPPVAMVQPPSPAHPMSTQPSSPILLSQSTSGVAKSDGGGEEATVYLTRTPHTQGLISSLNPHIPNALMATASIPITVSNSQNQHEQLVAAAGGGMGGSGAIPNQFEQPQAVPGVAGHPNANISSASLCSIVDSAAASANQYLPTHHPPPPPISVSTPHPPPHLPLHPNLTHTPGHTPQMESEPLLPNPPSAPLLPLVHPMPTVTPQHASSQGNGVSFPQHHHHQQQQQGSPLSSRKEILCRHYMIQGSCPFGEKCWFAHPEPLFLHGQPPRGMEGPNQGGGVSPSPLHVQVPWLNNPMVDYAAVASPPQSPLNHPALMQRIPAMFRPRGGGGAMAYSGQQPLLFLRSPLPGGPHLPGSNLPLIQTPIPMRVNPILKFALLSQVTPHGHVPGTGLPGEDNLQVTDVSQLATFADHFFVSYNSNLDTYRIIFGGNRSHQVSSWGRSIVGTHYVILCGL